MEIKEKEKMFRNKSRRIEAKKGAMNSNRCQLVQERALIARSPTDRDVKHFLDPPVINC